MAFLHIAQQRNKSVTEKKKQPGVIFDFMGVIFRE
jgi:hypothetical protein